jgi:exosortase D (VPLPA-CTERM-specific)
MAITAENKRVIWKEGPVVWGLVLCIAILLGLTFFEGFKEIVRIWNNTAEYSYGYIIPAITLFLIWQKKNRLEQIAFKGSWNGVFIAMLGFALLFVGNLSTLYVIVHYAFLIVLVGVTLSFTGWQGIRPILVPLLFLAFMIPLPVFIYNSLSEQLQLISSQLGVAIIRLFGISVFLEGNVIDLGTLKLQVVEACNGLRYLFPLMVLGFIAAYFFKGAFWRRVAIFFSTVPIAILMNGLRIGVIGVMVEYRGPSVAEGFLHDFEGWAVFMVCTGVLILEMWALAKFGGEGRPLREVFGLEFPVPTQEAQIQHRPVPKPFLGAAALLAVMTILSSALPQRMEVPPQRKDFSEFPLNLGQWRGKADRLEQVYVEALKFDDYLLADFLDASYRGINFYVAYYASQRKGESAHSPRSCIPGGGWEITTLTRRNVEGATIARQPLWVNRAVIQKGEDKQLVYYWFLQRGRVITSEYLVKWYLFWDALTRNRTDGALVRLVTPIKLGEDTGVADRRLGAFARLLAPYLATFVPE